jgi:hypothetical protein
MKIFKTQLSEMKNINIIDNLYKQAQNFIPKEKN